MTYNTIPQTNTLESTAKALSANGFTTEIVENGEAAKEKVLQMIPKGAEVFTLTSVTLDSIGLTEAINSGSDYNSVRNFLYGTTENPPAGREKQQRGAAPEYAVGSVHAITEDGKLLVASNTGSQLPAYAYGADHVIFVVGAQKIVSNVDEGMKRLYDYVLPLESERAKKAYGVPGSFISKLLILNKEINDKRIHVILVKEVLGY